jgi:cytochrome c
MRSSLVLVLGAALVVPAAAADVEHGRQLFVACAACHSDRPDALGPTLKGVVGRKTGAREDFRYSNPMKRAGFTWDEANLREYLADPQAKVKGNRMPFSGLADRKDIDDVVAYLATLK